MSTSRPAPLGVGLGYRVELHSEIAAGPAEIEWLEIIADQFLPLAGARRNRLSDISTQYRCVPHSLNLSVGGSAPLDEAYLHSLCMLAEFVDAPWSSDHLCFTEAAGIDLGHLTPVPWTREVARGAAAKIRRIQQRLGRPFLLENITYHFRLRQELSEAEFIREVLEQGDCWMLLDVSNVYTNSVNHGFDPYAFLDEIPLERVVQMHIAGGRWDGDWLEDSHDAPVAEPVWDLARYAADRSDLKAVLLERDAHFPEDFSVLLGELRRARSLVHGADV
jgi:uncharacterized protein